MKKIMLLFYNDFKNILREPMLILLMIGPFLMGGVLKWLIPFMTELLLPYFNLADYYSLIAGCVLLFIPMLMGTLVGFLLLDEKDDNIFLMLIVTPLGRKGYLAYRTLFPSVISLISSIIILPFINIIDISFLTIILVSLLTSLSAPLTALFFASIAGNKVEGLALSKGLGIFLAIPIIAYFINYPWRLIAGFVPYYWPIHTIVSIDYSTHSFWFHILVGVLIHIMALILVIKRYEKRVY